MKSKFHQYKSFLIYFTKETFRFSYKYLIVILNYFEFFAIVIYYLLLFLGSHESARGKGGKKGVDLREGEGVDRDWARGLGLMFAQRGLSVSLWGVVSFEGRGVGLEGMAPLADLTGGSVNRFVLGVFPKDERSRLTEALVRTLTAQLACKGVLKLRTSSGLCVSTDPTGHLAPDVDLPDVYRIAAATGENTLGYEFSYNNTGASKTATGDAVILQVAFSYDTLVESKEEFTGVGDIGGHEVDHGIEISGSDDSKVSRLLNNEKIIAIKK